MTDVNGPTIQRKSMTTDKKPTCHVVRAGAEFQGKQGHLLAPGISAQSVGSRRVHLQIARIPPGVKSNAHKHADHETAIYVLSGESEMRYGEKLEHHVTVSACRAAIQWLSGLSGHQTAGRAGPTDLVTA